MRLREGGYRQVERHSIAAEREAFGALLQTVEEITPTSPRYDRGAVAAVAAAAVPDLGSPRFRSLEKAICGPRLARLRLGRLAAVRP